MLLSLSIRDLAIIESVDVCFGEGLNALSGETGAGKSIVLVALGLLLGARGSADLVRTGRDQAEVLGHFSLDRAPAARAALGSLGFDPPAPGAPLTLRRTLSARGSGRAWIGGRPASVGALAALGRTLVDMAGQHDANGLLDPTTHLALLDAAGGCGDLAAIYAQDWATLLDARARQLRLDRAAEDAEARAVWLDFQLSELDGLSLKPGEEEALKAERALVRHAAELGQGLRAAEGLLYSGDHAASESLSRALTGLRRLAAIDPSLTPLLEALTEAGYQVEEAARALQARARGPAPAPGRLDAIETRLAEIERISRKHRCEAEALIARRQALAEERDQLGDLDDSRAAAADAVEQALRAAEASAGRLAAARRAAGGALSARVAQGLQQLAMPEARLGVAFTPTADGLSTPGGARLGERGLETAELLLSANPGEDLRPLARVASGGELSRILLALKLALRGVGGPGVLVFDEVDAGLGGRAAEQVGRALQSLAAEAQVICITHLASIAAIADHHHHVSKAVAQGRTRSEVRALDLDARVQELARMIGGGLADRASRATARQLLSALARVA